MSFHSRRTWDSKLHRELSKPKTMSKSCCKDAPAPARARVPCCPQAVRVLNVAFSSGSTCRRADSAAVARPLTPSPTLAKISQAPRSFGHSIVQCACVCVQGHPQPAGFYAALAVHATLLKRDSRVRRARDRNAFLTFCPSEAVSTSFSTGN